MGWGCPGTNYLNVHPETAPFGFELRFHIFEILEIACYSSGFKNIQALFQTKIHHFQMNMD